MAAQVVSGDRARCAGASDAELATLIRHAVWWKPLRHGISDDDSTVRPMSAIGG